tara:strand:- start:10 stop:447 length:438 start_codon:yes stop_codon:yes gene_type:complete
MKVLSSKIRYLVIFFVLINVLKVKADNLPFENSSEQNSELLIESNIQKSDLKNSIFYAEGDVILTNIYKKFIAKSNKAIFYKKTGKIKLTGNVEIISGDVNKIKAGEVIYSLKENKFEAISVQNQKVSTKLVFNENNVLSEIREK